MKKPENDDEAFEEKPRARRPEDAEERPRRKAPPPVDEGQIEEAEERPRRPPRARYEEEEDEDDRSRRRFRRDRDEPYSTMIPYRNAMALVGYYCGMVGLIAILGGIALIFYNPVNQQFVTIIFFGVVCALGGSLALSGVIFGIIGMVYANKNPKSRGMGHAIAGLVLGILEILGLLAILLFVGTIATRGRF
jgi:uncharacterized membrane protein